VTAVPPAEIIVRPATSNDCEAIAAIHVRSWQAGYAHIFDQDFLGSLDATIEERVAFWQNYFAANRPGQTMVVAMIDGVVVGFAYFGPARLHRYHDDDGTEQVPNPDEGRGEGYAMYVEPIHWGRGVGSALMPHVLDGLASSGFTEAVLWVLEDNSRARRLYETWGWRVDGRSDQFERGGEVTTEIAMWRPL
jgi:GNAT superfamily N-acetyltransferase